MTHDFNAIARQHSAYYEGDRQGFQRAARTLQSIWRQRQNLQAAAALGSELPRDIAEAELLNYLTPGIREEVSAELKAASSNGKLYGTPRIYTNLLSSQPLCFNLFGELKRDLGLATSVISALRPGKIRRVSNIEFEHSPERSSKRFTEDRSAFDVFVEYEAIDGGKGFLGIEVKYHEDLSDKVASHKPRYDEVAGLMECFRPSCFPQLREAPLQQLWRDHLLAGSMLKDRDLGYSEGAFIVIYPAANPHCRAAVRAYRQCLLDDSTFDTWTLDEMVGVLSLATSATWVAELYGRYLDFSRLNDPIALVPAGSQDEPQ
ncbi:hypothetical protein [Caenimonas sp. SL110]|uniref:PGN_0703 family putative restriction endonuclease n=1 Tax=Caenimonas sp. SL110 TaxID=1450524 RepID=UPI00069EFFDC|nr:hypothetical protein [Caenimonas sp. SL110]